MHRKQKLEILGLLIMWTISVSGMAVVLLMYIDSAIGMVTTAAITVDTGMDIMTTTGHSHIPIGRILTGISPTIITTPDPITIMRHVLITAVGNVGHNVISCGKVI